MKKFLYVGKINAGYMFNLQEGKKLYGYWDTDDEGNIYFIVWDCDISDFSKEELEEYKKEYSYIEEFDDKDFILVVKNINEYI